jgi:hypothetical protein
MNRGAWCAVACTAGGVLAVAVAVRLAGLSFGRPAPRRASVEVCGPDTPLLARMEAKRRVAGEVIDGRRSLLGAAAAYRALDAEWSPCPGITPPGPPPGASEGEYYCRMVIEWVKGEAPPDRAKGLAHDLEAELAGRLRAGTLQLPQIPTGGPKKEAE